MTQIYLVIDHLADRHAPDQMVAHTTRSAAEAACDGFPHRAVLTVPLVSEPVTAPAPVTINVYSPPATAEPAYTAVGHVEAHIDNLGTVEVPLYMRSIVFESYPDAIPHPLIGYTD